MIHPADHHLFVYRLVRPADKVAVQINIKIIHAAHKGQRLVDKEVIHIKGMLGQNQPALPQKLGAVYDGMHQQVLGGTEKADVLPGEQPVFRENVPIPHYFLGIILHMLVNIVAHQHVKLLPGGPQLPQLFQRGV
ncbi:hypothetical protein SDC9_185521 [bioreactor metagenome]|uniref:Uncharacterized protein n=1 Tax=bioreactor metagenome TaxID=1076179 RepID=A0A645HII0_9ZZZZ